MSWINGLLEWIGMDGEERTFEGKLCLDLLQSGQASLNPAQQQALWQHRVVEPDSMEKDPYMAALWVKYPYAQTVHKAQGGRLVQSLSVVGTTLCGTRSNQLFTLALYRGDSLFGSADIRSTQALSF